MQNVIGVRGHDQMFDRQAHSLCVVPCEDIPEVASGHAETDLTVQAREELEIGVEVVRDLEHDPRPVDGIHCSQRVLFLEVQVCKQLLHNVLAIVEGSFDGHAMHIVIQNAGHLLLLNVRHTSLWKEDEAVHVLLAPHSIDGSATGVTTGGAKDGQPLSIALQEVLVEVPQGLKGHVLEGEGWAVEEFHDPQVVHLDAGYHLIVIKSLITSLHETAEVLCWYLVSAAIEACHLECQLVKFQLGPTFVNLRDIGHGLRYHETSIWSQSFEHGLLEAEPCGSAVGASIRDRRSHFSPRRASGASAGMFSHA
mmetsp:Transcript_9241/g.15798  ORF Transcript_9241/g.15798 Transcript_9241/m.15798 type:complete len:309 (-) Transcript_9241:1-927(-)